MSMSKFDYIKEFMVLVVCFVTASFIILQGVASLIVLIGVGL